MFRLDISHLQGPTLTLPDALSTLGSTKKASRKTPPNITAQTLQTVM